MPLVPAAPEAPPEVVESSPANPERSSRDDAVSSLTFEPPDVNRGFYRFELEQNMRDDTLLNVKAVGLRIEEYQK